MTSFNFRPLIQTRLVMIRFCSTGHDLLCYGSGKDAFLLEPLFRNDTWGFMLRPVSETNERGVYQSMLDGCRTALQVLRCSPAHTSERNDTMLCMPAYLPVLNPSP